MLRRTPVLALLQHIDPELIPLLAMVAPLRDTPDLMIAALDALLDYYLETTVNPTPGPYVLLSPYELRSL